MDISKSKPWRDRRHRFRIIRTCLAAFICLIPGIVLANAVFIVPSRSTGIHDSIARYTNNGLRQILPAGTVIQILYPGQDQVDVSTAGKNDLVIAIGTDAYANLLAGGVQAKILAALVPRPTYQLLTARSGRTAGTSTAVYIEQPVHRSLDLARLVLPDRTVGVLLGSRASGMYSRLQKIQKSSAQGIYLRQLGKDENLISALEQVLEHSSVLIAYADPEVSNRNTAQHILLTSYRHGVPVIAYSRAYVKAGAMMAVYSKPEQYAQQMIELARSAIDRKKLDLPLPQYPKYFSVEVNPNVARSLGISLKPVGEIEQQLETMAGSDG
jgi:putative ABC transport system substrate-binding protein